jgi:hypothetical protein
MDPRQGTQDVDVSQADVLTKVFSRENVAYTLKRLASARDKDNLIAHPSDQLSWSSSENNLAKRYPDA